MNMNYSSPQCYVNLPQRAMAYSLGSQGDARVENHLHEMAPKSTTTCRTGEGYPNKDRVSYVLSSQEKVDFLKKCCASPLLRFILHLLSDPRQETLISWYGGPFGVKIWNTRKFTEQYNAAMGTNMNFTNVSRALQACEHITIAGVRLWKRRKQGEYSFFPCYTGHGFPNIPPAAMPKDIPPYFPFERRSIVKTPQSRPQPSYGDCSPPPDTDHLLPVVCYKQPPPYHMLTPEHHPPPHSSTTSHLINYQTSLPQYSPQMLSPAPSLGSFRGSSPTVSMTSPSSFPVLCSVLTPPPSDTSSCSSDSFALNDSLATHSYSPLASFGPSQRSFTDASEDALPAEAFTVAESSAEVAIVEDTSAKSHLPFLAEYSSNTEIEEVSPLSLTIPENPVLSPNEFNENSQADGEDIFGNFSSILGYDVSIDETSLLYH